jgi:hypothetical protein
MRVDRFGSNAGLLPKAGRIAPNRAGSAAR